MTRFLRSDWRWLRLTMAVCVTLASGCRVGPDYTPPTVPAPAEWHQESDDIYQTDKEDVGAWWTLLNDPVLDALIECSVDGNMNLYAALTRIWQARSQICIAESAKSGVVEANGAYTRSQQSLNAIGAGGAGGGPAGFLLGVRKISSLGLATSWEPDVWGRVARQVESAEDIMCANVEAYRDVLVILYGDIASTYIQIRTLQTQLEYTRQNVQIQERALELVQRRVEGGISPVAEEYQAERNLTATQAEIPLLDAQLHQALNRLAVLAGEYPGTLHDCLASPMRIPAPPEKLPVVLPCNVIRQRPDIRQTERLLAARTAEVGVAVSDLFPRFRLGGSFSFSADDMTNLFDDDSWGYSFGPSFTWLIFNAGRVKCNIQQTKFAVEEAIANYQQAVLRGIEEVENGLVAYTNERERQETLRRTVTAAEKALEATLELYRNDKLDFQNVLNSLSTLFLSQNALAASEGQTIQNLISVYRAMGGGWDVNAHCEDRCVRLKCPQRADASVVEIEPKGDVSERYFDRGKSTDNRESAVDPDELDLPDFKSTDGSDVSPEEEFDVDGFFKRVLDPKKQEPATDGLDDATEDPFKDRPTEVPSEAASETEGPTEPATLNFRASGTDL